jgi:hypothetical protein
MNLTDYPTPKTNHAVKDGYTFNGEDIRTAIEFSQQLEREAAAWRAVAEKYRSSEFVKGTIGVLETLKEADEAFDALKSQLTQP